MFGYYKGVHALTARSQRLELYAVDFIRVSGSLDPPAPRAAVIPPVRRAQRQPPGKLV